MGLTFLDFFAGIGGFRLGMQQAGHIPVGWVEWDKFARKSFEAIHNPEGEWTAHDIRSVDYRDMPRADVWTFGFPCQDISVAGNQEGFNGERSSLFFSVTRLLRQTKEWDPERLPSYLFIENVKNFLSVNDGWDFLAAQIELDEIGYDCEWQVLNSKDFGVPQNRERVFVIGHLRGRGTRQVFPLFGKNGEVTSKLQELTIGLSDADRVYDSTGLARTLKAEAGGGGAKTGLYLVGNVHPSGNGMNGQVFDSKGLAPTLTTNKGEGNKILIRPVLTPDREEKRQNGRRFKNPDEPMFTLTTQDKHGIYDGAVIRKLTPRECFRLQGFPDWVFDRAEAVNKDTQLYKQAGNSVTVDVVVAIASQFEIAI